MRVDDDFARFIKEQALRKKKSQVLLTREIIKKRKSNKGELWDFRI